MFEEAVKRVLAKCICPQRFSYKPLRIITSLMKSSSFCCFRDRWYIMGNKAYNYIFHKVSFDFIASILLESAGNKPSSDSLSFSEKSDAGSGGRGGEGWGCGRSNIPFPLLPARTNSGWNVFSPPLPPPRNFFLLTQDGGLSFPEDIRRNHVVVAEGARSSLPGTKTATLKGVFVTRFKLNQSFEKPLLQHV